MVASIPPAKCRCGAISMKFDPSVTPERAFSCFCTDCSLGAGGLSHIYVAIPESSMTLTEAEEGKSLAKYDMPTHSGQGKKKYFCSKCGCPVMTKVNAWPDLIVILGSMFEGGLEKFIPTVEYWTKYRPSWVPPVEGAEQMETQ